jgi:hypothetical protein
MIFADQARVVRFIHDAKEQRQWLSRELSSLETSSENFESNRRAICGAIRELDKAIAETIDIYRVRVRQHRVSG